MNRFILILISLFYFGASQELPAADTLKIYVPGSYTGFMPFLADGIHRAARAFADRTNREGGLLGKQIEVIVQDDKANLSAAEKNAEVALKDPNHLVSIGHPFSSFAYPIGKMYKKKQQLLLTPYATNPSVSSLQGTVFQLCFNDVFQAKTLASVATHRLKAKRIFVLKNESDPYSEGLARLFAEDINAKKPGKAKTALSVYRYIFDHLDKEELIAKIKEFQPDLIFIPELKIRAAEIVRLLIEKGLGRISLLGADGWGSEDGTLDIFFSGAKQTHLGKYYYTYHWHEGIKTPENKRLVALLEKETGKKAYGPGILAYEGLEQIRRTAERIKSTNNAALAKAMRPATFEGVTGQVQYLTNGTTARHLVLLQLLPDGLTLHSLVKPE